MWYTTLNLRHQRCLTSLNCPPLLSLWFTGGCVSSSFTVPMRSYTTRKGRQNRHYYGNSSPSDAPISTADAMDHLQVSLKGAALLAKRLQESPWHDMDDFSDDEGSSTRPAQDGAREQQQHRHGRHRHRQGHSGSAVAWSTQHDDARRPSSSPLLPQLQPQRAQRSTIATTTITTTPAPAEESKGAASRLVAEALSWSIGGESNVTVDVEDDDIVLDTPASLLPTVTAAVATGNAATHELRVAHQRRLRSSSASSATPQPGFDDLDVETPEGNAFAHPAARGVGQDVIDLVTDAFAAQREAEVKRRRELLYELTHPNPIDYTYNGKLVPPPPLSFGQVTEEARSLGNKLMLGQTYSLVRQAGTRASEDDYCGTIYTSAKPPSSSSGKTAVSPSSTIELSVGGPSSSSSAFSAQRRAPPYRSRAREDNIFRDHNYFFELNELYQEIVLVGKACAGKSSLLNSLLGQHVAKTSSNPNTTRKISFYQSVTPEQLHEFHAKEHHNQLVKLPGGGLQLTFVDMPGYGIEGMSEQWRDAAIELTDAYFGVRRSVNTVLYCMDCERGLTKTDMKYFQWLENVQGTFFVVLTKCDSVPHSRITSVMRQVYALITKNRRKYRKVFPFIIPTSAKDGTNVELLRGLITETSGMISGDKLRDLLQQKKEAFTQAALLEEAGRVDAVRQLERAQAREFFQLTRGAAALEGKEDTTASLSNQSSISSIKKEEDHHTSRGSEVQSNMADQPAVSAAATTDSAGAARDVSAAPQRERGPQRYVLGLSGDQADLEESLFLSGQDASPMASAFPNEATAAEAAMQARRERRERFLAWRRAHPLATAQPSYDEPVKRQSEQEEKTDVDGVHDTAPTAFNAKLDFVKRGYCGTPGAYSRKQRQQVATQHRGRGSRSAEREAAVTSTTAAVAPLPSSQGKEGRYRLHTGLDNPQAVQTVLEVPGDAETARTVETTAGGNGVDQMLLRQRREEACDTASAREGTAASPTPPSSFALSPSPPLTRSSVIGFTPGPVGGAAPLPPSSTHFPPSHHVSSGGRSEKETNSSIHGGCTNNHKSADRESAGGSGTGAVSHFLSTLEKFSQQPNIAKSAKQRRKEVRWQRTRQGQRVRGGRRVGGLLAEDASGRLSSYQAGKPCGPAVVTLDTALETRQAQWRAAQLKALIMKENPEAPWQAMQQLRRKLQTRQEDAALSGMRKKEVAAYMRDAGRVTESFEKFEGEVTAAKYMNEIRQAPTLRSQQQMHLNATAKINYRSMPPGLWKRYGEKETYWPTPRVLGRAQDESHKP